MLIFMMTEGMLADLGCESVTAAATVEKALGLIDEQVFDACILDMNLSGNDTHAVADALAARGVPFVFATGYSSRELRGQDRDRPLLRKPFLDKQLAAIMARLLPR